MNWVESIKLAVEDPGVIYRVFYCERCSSLRYHKVVRFKITKVEGTWWIFFSRKCSGLPPTIGTKRPRMVRYCGYETRQWLVARQWNALCLTDVYSTLPY